MYGKARPGSQLDTTMIQRRQYVEDEDGRLVWFWYTKTGYIIKWVLFLSFILIMAVWIVGGRIHAKKRLRKGLKPMGYHAWLLSRQERARVDPAYAWPQAHYAQYPPPGPGGYGTYGMQPMPPPVYDPNRPPMYDGQGMPQSKVDPNQQNERFKM
ncbi:hypothetical protein F5Y15DRAFT_421165 [Xylariaceae sp. FL0016]|nr:hypothetical protein F5Y15DRAFT_421165 [Xylariaceae sp. FL0016]